MTTNGAGLRGCTEVSSPKAPRTRVAIFGCSQTFGSGVGDDETYSARLGALLPGAEVLNFGVEGYGTDQMLLYYENEGVKFVPDVVVLAFAFYHIERNEKEFRFFAKPRFALAGGRDLALVNVPVPSPEELLLRDAVPGPLPLVDRSVLLRWLWQRHLDHELSRFRRPDTEAWRVTEAILTSFRRRVAESGATMVLVNIDHGAPEIDAALHRLAAVLDVPFLDVAPGFRERERRHERLRLSGGNPHWNADGHRLMAEALRDYLCTTGIVPRC